MAFNDMYVYQGFNFYGKPVKLQIQQEGYAGDVREMTLAGTSPINIETTKGDVTDTIRGKGCVVNIENNVGEDYTHLFLSPAHTFKVICTIDSAISFTGFIDSEFYEEPFLAAPFDVDMSASDGLKGLDVYDPTFLTENAAMTLISIIDSLLKQTGLNLPLEIKDTLLSEDMDVFGGLTPSLTNQSETHFAKAQVFTKAFAGKNSKEVLEDVLKGFDCKIYQDGDVWRIDRLNDKINLNAKYIRYIDGVVSGTSSTSTIKVVAGSGDNLWMNRSQNKKIQQPYASQQITGEIESTSELIGHIAAANDTGSYNPNGDYIDLSNIDQNTFFKQQVNAGDISFLNEKFYDEAYRYGYENGGFKFNLPTKEKTEGNLDTLLRWRLSAGYVSPVSMDNWLENTESERVNFSYTSTVKLKPYAELVVDMPELSVIETDGTSTLVSVLNYTRIAKKDKFGVVKWLKWGGKDNGYSFEDYDSSNSEDFAIESSEAFINVVLNPAGNEKELLSKTVSSEVSLTMQNASKTKYEEGTLDINETLSETDQLFMIAQAPQVKIFIKPLFNSAIYNVSGTGYLDAWSIGDLSMDHDDEIDYTNAYTGVLDGTFSRSRKAPEIEIALWNPVKIGKSDEARGLISSTSSWWNRNVNSNILKYYGAYTDINNLDDNAGLGLWYTIADLVAAGDTTNLGNRLPVNLLRSYFEIYSNPQEIYTGTMESQTPLNYRNIYEIAYGDDTKDFVMGNYSYDVLGCIGEVTFIEVKFEDINLKV